MAFNLLIGYDLKYPGQNYYAVRRCIESLGAAYPLQQSVYYLKTALSPSAAYSAIRTVMDLDDKLLVFEALNGVVSHHYPEGDLAVLNLAWFLPSIGLPHAAAAYLPQH